MQQSATTTSPAGKGAALDGSKGTAGTLPNNTHAASLYTFTTGPAGANDHTIGFGFVPNTPPTNTPEASTTVLYAAGIATLLALAGYRSRRRRARS